MFGFSVEWRHLQYPNEVASMDSLLAAFEGIDDPHVERTKAYPLADIMFLILCAVLCGVLRSTANGIILTIPFHV